MHLYILGQIVGSREYEWMNVFSSLYEDVRRLPLSDCHEFILLMVALIGRKEWQLWWDSEVNNSAIENAKKTFLRLCTQNSSLSSSLEKWSSINLHHIFLSLFWLRRRRNVAPSVIIARNRFQNTSSCSLKLWEAISHAPDRPFHNFTVSQLGDQLILCSSGTSCVRFDSFKVAKWVGRAKSLACCSVSSQDGCVVLLFLLLLPLLLVSHSRREKKKKIHKPDRTHSQTTSYSDPNFSQFFSALQSVNWRLVTL